MNMSRLRWYREADQTIRYLALYGGQWEEMYPVNFPPPGVWSCWQGHYFRRGKMVRAHFRKI